MQREGRRAFLLQLLCGFLGALLVIVPIYAAVYFFRVSSLEREQGVGSPTENLPVEQRAESRTLALLMEDQQGELMGAVLLRADTGEGRLAVCTLRPDTVLLEDKQPVAMQEVYSESGAAAAAAAIRDTLVIETDGYIALSFQQLMDLVDSLGGFELTLLEDLELLDRQGELETRLYAGTSTLTGYQAAVLIRACGDGRLSLDEALAEAVFLQAAAGDLGELAAEVYSNLSGFDASDITPISGTELVQAFSEVGRQGASVSVTAPLGNEAGGRRELLQEELLEIEMLFSQPTSQVKR